MTANEMQIGGDHYKSDYQHWDWCIDIHLGYLEGCASKYICRWRDKKGVEDLNKASHYLTKILEASYEGRYRNNSFHNASTPSIRINAHDATKVFIKGQTQITHLEQTIILGIAHWRNDEELETVIESLNNFIAVVIREQRNLDQEDAKMEERPRRTGINHPAPFGYDGEE